MKLLTALSLLTFSVLTLSAQTTMCFKENHASMSTINQVALDGGLCNGEKTIKNMNDEGWTTEDIKINNNNYIYIFKKVTTINEVNMEALENRVLQRIKQEKIEEKKLEKEKIAKSKIRNGQKIYNNKCSVCHGANGELAIYGKQAINTLNLRDFKIAINEYSTGQRTEYDKSNDRNKITPYAKLMVPYANILNTNKIHNVYLYLKSIKKSDKIKEKK